MRIGVALPHGVNSGIGLPGWSQLRDLAVRLETAGFDALWVSDHFFTDLEGSSGSGSQLDAMVLLPALAVATHRVTLGTMVLTVGFRPPSVLAKAVASLDRLSAGRFVLGLGAGSREAEYVAAGLDFPEPADRIAELEEAAILIREMTSHPHSTVNGPRFRVTDAPNLPQPARPTIPILMSASGPHGLAASARSADIWNVSGRYSPESYGAEAADFDRACDDVGRDPQTVERSLGLVALVGDDESDVRRRLVDWKQQAPWLFESASLEEVRRYGLVGTPQEVRERIEEFDSLGVTELVLSFSPLMFGWSSSAGWDIVAEEVLPVFGGAHR